MPFVHKRLQEIAKAATLGTPPPTEEIDEDDGASASSSSPRRKRRPSLLKQALSARTEQQYQRDVAIRQAASVAESLAAQRLARLQATADLVPQAELAKAEEEYTEASKKAQELNGSREFGESVLGSKQRSDSGLLIGSSPSPPLHRAHSSPSNVGTRSAHTSPTKGTSGSVDSHPSEASSSHARTSRLASVESFDRTSQTSLGGGPMHMEALRLDSPMASPNIVRRRRKSLEYAGASSPSTIDQSAKQRADASGSAAPSQQPQHPQSTTNASTTTKGKKARARHTRTRSSILDDRIGDASLRDEIAAGDFVSARPSPFAASPNQQQQQQQRFFSSSPHQSQSRFAQSTLLPSAPLSRQSSVPTMHHPPQIGRTRSRGSEATRSTFSLLDFDDDFEFSDDATSSSAVPSAMTPRSAAERIDRNDAKRVLDEIRLRSQEAYEVSPRAAAARRGRGHSRHASMSGLRTRRSGHVRRSSMNAAPSVSGRRRDTLRPALECRPLSRQTISRVSSTRTMRLRRRRLRRLPPESTSRHPGFPAQAATRRSSGRPTRPTVVDGRPRLADD